MASSFRPSSAAGTALQLVRRVVGTLFAWSPVWISAILIWQFTTRGLRPAQAEQSRLEQAAPAVQERHTRRRQEFEVMAAERDAWYDPVYRERRRRLRAAAATDEQQQQQQQQQQESTSQQHDAGESAPR